MRKLIPTMLAVLALYSTAGYSLGLGDIHLRSALNQPFSAEIELLSVTSEEAETIAASLASYESFSQLGVDRPSVLMLLGFDVKQRSNGSYFVQVSSQKPIREPFLDFLLEVNWRSGRVLREYTVLLDPPELFKESAPSVAAPSVARGSTGNAASSSRTPSAAAPSASRPLTYGPVKKNETLWSIARQMRPNRSVSIPQMMIALQKANPEAFERGNVNLLKSGSVLRLEDPALLSAMSQAAAAREVNRQSRAWEDYKQQAAEAAARRAPTAASAPSAAAVATTEQPRLKLVAAEEGKPLDAKESAGSAPEGSDPEQLRRELMLALETAEAQRQQNEELRGRLQELESQMASMQRLLTLQNDDMALLQSQLGAVPEQVAPPQSGEAPAQADFDSSAGNESVQSRDALSAAGLDETKAIGNSTASPEADVPTKAASVSSVAEAVIKDLLANPVVVGGLSFAVLSLLTLIWLIVRRRRHGPDFQESILTGGTSSMLRAKQKEGDASQETSFFSDFAVSGMGEPGAEDAKVDPLTEADVYMAYGRHQQAEELLNDAIRTSPDRPELHAKLLEVYHARKDRRGFENAVVAAQPLLFANSELWDRVLVMGHELAPDNPLFEAASNTGSVNLSSGFAAASQADVLDIGVDLDALTEDMEGSVAREGGADDFKLDLGLDFSDLEEFDLPEEPDSAVVSQPAETNGLSLAGAAGATALPEELDLADFDLLDLDTPEAPGNSAPAADGLDFDLGELDLDLGDALEQRATKSASPGDDLADLSEFSLDDLAEETPIEPLVSADQASENVLERDLADLDDLTLTDEPAALLSPSVTTDDEDDLVALLDEIGADGPEEAVPSLEPAEALPELDSDLADLTDLGDLDDFAFETEPQSDATTDSPAESVSPLMEGSNAEDLSGLDDLDLGELDLAASPGPATDSAVFDMGDLPDLDALDALDSLDEDDLDSGLFGELDETATKLDLARAYVDMGDAEGARSILDEVLNEGTEAQKQSAEQLLQQIA